MRAAVLVPKGTIIPKAAMNSSSAFGTYVWEKFNSDYRKLRWFAFVNLDDFKDGTKKPSSEDTGLIQTMILKYAPVFTFRYLSNMGNFIEALQFHNQQALFDVYFIDANGTWHGRLDPTGAGGLASYTLQQFFVQDRGPITDKTANQYMLDIHLFDRKQINENFKYYAAGTDIASIQMLENAVLTDVSDILGMPLSIDTTTDMVFIAKTGQDSTDLVAQYLNALTAPMFICKNLTANTTPTVSINQIGQIIVAGQTYNYVWATLSGSVPSAGDIVQLALREPSVTNAIIPNFDQVTEILQVGVNGANAAVRIF